MDRAISFGEFRQVVRRYRPSHLLPVLAGMAAERPFEKVDVERARYISPWGIALIARESILWGNEHRDSPVDAEALRRLFNAVNNIHEPLDQDDLLSMLIRVVYEQFPYQESIYEEVSRTHELLVEPLGRVETEVLSPTTWSELLDAPLVDMVGATFVLQVGANMNAGWFDPAWLDQANFVDVLARWPREHILARLEQLSTSIQDFKKAYAAAPKPAAGQEQYAFNPLSATPFVRMGDGRLLAPQPRLIFRTISPGGLYYPGIKRYGEAFARDLGALTQHYVGRQLRCIESADVQPEIRYGKPERRSIDWFLVLPTMVVMFEVKSARFGLLARAAEGHEHAIKHAIGEAVDQLAVTDAVMVEGRQEFQHLPRDRPRVGVVVTSEPLYLANSTPARDLVPTTRFPTITASLRDIEMLVTLPADKIEDHLSEILHDPERSTWQLGLALRDVARPNKNPLLDRGWQSYWPDDG